MKHEFSFAFLTPLLVLCLGGLSGARAFTSRSITIPGSSNVYVYGINDFGAMVLTFTDAAGTSHCLSMVGSTVTRIDDPSAIGTGPGKGTSCYAINNSGVIVGSYSAAVFGNGFTYSGGVFNDVIVPTATAGTVASGINSSGNIVGFFSDDVGEHGFVYTASNGLFHTLDVPGAAVTLGVAINDPGTITLQWYDSTFNIHGAVLSHGMYMTLDVPGVAKSAIHGINKYGSIIFKGTEASGAAHGYLYKGGTFTQFDVTNAANTSGWTINSKGQIVGGYNPASNPTAQVGFVGHF